MPQVSRNRLSPTVEKNLLHALDIILLRITHEKEIDAFLLALLTKTERLMLAKRLAIVLLIKEGLNDTQIAESLHMTRITVSRMRYFFESRGSGYEIAYRILENEKLVADLKKILLRLGGYAARAAGGRLKPEIL